MGMPREQETFTPLRKENTRCCLDSIFKNKGILIFKKERIEREK